MHLFELLLDGLALSADQITERRRAAVEFEYPTVRLACHAGVHIADARELIYGAEQHKYKDYVRLLFAWALNKGGEAEQAKKVLEERWKDVEPQRPFWPMRLAQGDQSVWREMLIGHAVGALTRAEILGPLENDESFAKSPLAKLGFTPDELRCEGFFYAALVEDVTGDPASASTRRGESLKRAIGSRVEWYEEFVLAKYLLKHANDNSPSTSAGPP